MSEEPNQTIASNPYVNQANESVNQGKPKESPPSYVEAVNSPIHPPKPPPAGPTTNIVVSNRIVSRHPSDIFCPTCNQIVHSRVETSSTILTFLLAIILLFFCLCLVVLPFCFSSCKRTTHYCPNCNRNLGEVREFQ